MAIEILDASDRRAMRTAGRTARRVLREVCSRVQPGMSTLAIDTLAREVIHQAGARPSQLGYHGYPAVVCTSRNEVVCHGIPRPHERVRSGDILNIDVTTEFEGWHGDTSVTLAFGEPRPDAQKVQRVALECLEVGIDCLGPGVRLGDVGHAIERHAARHGCGSVAQYCGHGIGRSMHQAPQVVHTGPAGRGVRLRPGMCITLEPMITIGRPRLRVLDDGWSVVTADGSPSAQFEHTILITETGAEVLTADEVEAPLRLGIS